MFTSLLIAVAVQKAALLLLSVCLATVLGNELLPELPLTAADFTMEVASKYPSSCPGSLLYSPYVNDGSARDRCRALEG